MSGAAGTGSGWRFLLEPGLSLCEKGLVRQNRERLDLREMLEKVVKLGKAQPISYLDQVVIVQRLGVARRTWRVKQ